MPTHPTDHPRIIFKICPRSEWDMAIRAGRYGGSAHDRRDGFIHFSAGNQLAATAAKHFRDQPDLVLVAVDAVALGDALRWEPSRGGDLFPHLYGVLPVSAATAVTELMLDSDGMPVLPELTP